MQQRYVGRSGLRVSRLGLGTLTWGRDTDELEAAEQLQEFLDAGGTMVATGARYAAGRDEEVLGKLLGPLVPRHEVVVVATAGVACGPEGPDLSRRGLLAALDATLARLGTDHVDAWLLPGWNDRVPLEESLDAVDQAVARGRARYAGLADLPGWRTATALAAAGTARPIAVQAEYSLVQRGIEREVVPAARALGLGVLAWSPLGRGTLTGKYRTGVPADSRGASPHLADFVAPYLGRGAGRIVDAVVTAGEGLGCAPLEVALAWVRDRPGVASVLLGARTAAQLRGALTVEDLVLPTEIRAALDEVSAPGLGYPEVRRDDG